MDSGSPQARVDQFFASKKKRKCVSPGLKSKRIEKDGKTTAAGDSPSAKGSLVNFLVTSEENNKPSPSASDSPSRRVPITRNLTLDISSSFKAVVKEPLLSAEVHSETLDDVGVAIAGSYKGSSETEEALEVGNPELKQFATDFLSLYCSELLSSASTPSKLNKNANKRHGSPSRGDIESKSCKRLHCSTDGAQFNIQGVGTCSSMQMKPMQSTMVAKSDESATTVSKEVSPGEKEVQLQACLRKCTILPSSLNTPGCHTPGLLGNKVGAIETPKSSRGSSMFSPGETFWNEAIQVADGLLGPTDNNPSKEDSKTLKYNNEIRKSNDLVDGRPDNNLDYIVDGGTGQVLSSGKVSAVGDLTKHGKEVVKEASPLPVKHFDFSMEAKNLNEESSPHTKIRKCHISKDKEIQCVSLNHERVQNDVILSTPGGANTNYGLLEVQENNLQPDAGEKILNFSIQDSDHATSDGMGLKLSGLIPNNDKNCTTSSFATCADRLDINNWLPSEICSIYKKRGIWKLYPWQVDCLLVDGVMENRNLVYGASTSAGKSFVAEILMLRRVLLTGKLALLVLPYVSICAEKAEHLEALLEPLNKQVRSYYGNQGGGTIPKDTSVAVCTIEKANSLINRFLEEGRLPELGIIVIDELHMVGDQHRGYLLELMLTKLRYAGGEGNAESSSGESSGTSGNKSETVHGLQIVGMSATLPNVAAVADWLRAALYETDFRPVPLEEYIKVGHAIYNKQMEIVRTVSRVADLGGKDPDHIVELCNEVVQEGHSVLIFCSSRKGCESTARHVARYLKKFSISPSNNQSETFGISSAIDALRRSPAGLDPVLEETLPAGVAYHHAGLTVEERETVETCYRKGLVRVLTATSTLAAGVNLPARRVIFRQPRIGRDFIDGTKYKQMAGRAGRTGIDTKGESILVCKPEEVKRIMGLLNDGCPPLHSCLSEDRNGMTHAILEVVAGGIVQTANDINRYVRCTLLNSTKPFEDVVKSAQDSLRWLCHKRFLEWNEDTKLYTSTPLGRASFGSSLSPEESLIVLDDLVRAREGFVLASDLHLVYLVTPINVEVEPDWELYYERFMELSSLEQSVGNRVGVQEPFLMRMAHGAPIRTSNRSKEISKGFQGRFDSRSGTSNQSVISDEQILRVCKRFYIALILSRLVQEVPVVNVCNAFKVARGMVQSLQENAGRFASMVSVFCERLGWHDLEGLVGKFQNRVSFGVRAEIVELTTIPHIKGSRARALYKAGLRTPQAIAGASIPEIAKAIFESSSWSTQGPVQKRMQLGVAKKIKNGARKIVLDKAEEARLSAFAAFKSLGLNVPVFARPLLSTAAGHALPKEVSTSSGEESSSSLAGLQRRKQEDEKIAELLSETHKEKLAKASLSGIRELEGPNSADARLDITLPEKSASVVKGPSSHCYQLKVSTDHGHHANASSPHQLTGIGCETNACDGRLDQVGHPQHERANPQSRSKESEMEKGPRNASSTPGGFDSFLDLWDGVSEFYFDIHFNKISEVNKAAPFEIHGMAVCWENSPVYYINVPKDLFWSNCKTTDNLLSNGPSNTPPLDQLDLAKLRWNKITSIMGRKDIKKFTWNLKVQIQVLTCPAISIHRFGSRSVAVKSMGLNLIDNSYYMLPPIYLQNAVDQCIVAWILWPDEEKSSCPNLEKEVKKRLSCEAAAAASRSGRWKNQMRRASHNGCCRRVAQIRALTSVLWKLLISEELVEVLLSIEIPLVHVLAQMELWGIGVDMEGCLHARHVLGRKLRDLEKEAYKLAGMSFSLYTAADIANVLYQHLKLPIPEGHKKGKCHPSTDKHCLDVLRNDHPIIPVIREHRTLAKLLNSTLGSICSLSKLSMRTQSYTLHGHWLQTSTATGRLSMEEPNLQCVEHMVEFKLNTAKEYDNELVIDHHKVNARDFFVPTQENMVLLTADYSQIELRMMAHFSKDTSLIELLTKPQGDVFTMLAAKWTGKVESGVSSQEREHTKRLVYGILYGMGANTLAEQLNCSSDEAAEKIHSFKRSFPGVASWLQEVVSSCREKGYVKTLKGRKRFLAKIKLGNSKEKSKAQRQAVNSICQGSAADVIKIAMINIHSVIIDDTEKSPSRSPFSEKFHMLQGRCRILLQVHDELVMEADSSVVKEAGLFLQLSMESAASLLVPLHVKLKVGRTWGSMELFQAEKI